MRITSGAAILAAWLAGADGSLSNFLDAKTVAGVQAAIKNTAEVGVQKLKETASNAEDLTSSLANNITEVKRVAEKTKNEAAAELEKAAEAFKQSARNASASPFDSAMERLKQGEIEKGASAADLVEAAKRAAATSKEEIADTIRQVVPQVADAVNATGHDVAAKLPKVSVLVNRTGKVVADKIHKPPPAPAAETEVVNDEEPVLGTSRQSLVVVGGFLLLAVTGVSGYAIANRVKSRTARSPMLLSDALDTVRTTEPVTSRTPALQMANQEPYSQF